MPPARHSEIRLGLERLTDEPVAGGWCDDCALPSLLSVDLVLSLNEQLYSVIRVSRCANCGKVTPDG
jgi:hypothetical protein